MMTPAKVKYDAYLNKWLVLKKEMVWIGKLDWTVFAKCETKPQAMAIAQNLRGLNERS